MGTATHDERLTVPWHWWPLSLAIVAVLAAPFGFGALGWPGWLVAFGGLGAATVAGLWWLGRVRVAVVASSDTGNGDGDAGDGDAGDGDRELLVDDARLPVRYIATVIALDAEGRRELLGVHADPLAFVVQRPWVSGAVQVVLDDPADPTPYWLVSTRHPQRLAGALERASDPAPEDEVGA